MPIRVITGIKVSLRKEIKNGNDIENELDKIKNYDEEYYSKIKLSCQTSESKGENQISRLLATNKMLLRLKDQNISQYFIDGTFKCKVKGYTQLIVCLGYNKLLKKFQPCFFGLLQSKKFEAYVSLYKAIMLNVEFSPSTITVDFEMANIKAIKTVFKDCKIITCYFHLIQSWWRWGNANGLRNQDVKSKTKDLILNLKALPFNKREDVNVRYANIKNHFEKEYPSIFTKFFSYFEDTWLNGIFEKELWNYAKFLIRKDDKVFISKDVFFTNNCVESINRTLNMHLKGKCNLTVEKFNEILNIITKIYETNEYKNVSKKSKGMKKSSVSSIMCFMANCGKNTDILKGKTYSKILQDFDVEANFNLEEDASEISDNFEDHLELKQTTSSDECLESTGRMLILIHKYNLI